MTEIFPPTHHCILVVFFNTRDKGFQVTLCSSVSASEQLDCTIHSHFLAEVKSHFNLFKAVLISIVLIYASDSVTIQGPCHSEESHSHFLEDFLSSINLLVALDVLGSPSVQVVLHVALVGRRHKLSDVLCAHVLA